MKSPFLFSNFTKTLVFQAKRKGANEHRTHTQFAVMLFNHFQQSPMKSNHFLSTSFKSPLFSKAILHGNKSTSTLEFLHNFLAEGFVVPILTEGGRNHEALEGTSHSAWSLLLPSYTEHLACKLFELLSAEPLDVSERAGGGSNEGHTVVETNIIEWHRTQWDCWSSLWWITWELLIQW